MAQQPLERSLAAVLALSLPFGVAPLHWTSSQPRVSGALVVYGAVLFCATSVLFISEIVDFILLWTEDGENMELKVSQKVFRLEHKFNDLIVFGFGTVRGARRMSVMLGILHDLGSMTQHKTPRKDHDVYFIGTLLIFSLIFGLRTLEFVVLDKEDNSDIKYRNLKSCFVKLVLRSASDLMQLQFVMVALLIDTLLPVINRELQQLLNENNSPSKLTVSYLRLQSPTLAIAPLRHISFTVDSIGLLGSYPVGAPAARMHAGGARGAGGRVRAAGRGYAAWCRAGAALAASEGGLLAVHVLRLALHLATGLLSFIDTLLALYRATFNASTWPVASLEHSAETVLFVAMLVLLVEPAHRAQAELRQTRLLVSHALSRALELQQLDQLSELRLLAEVLQLSQPGYSALGVCSLGRPLVTTSPDASPFAPREFSHRRMSRGQAVLSSIVTINIMIFQ